MGYHVKCLSEKINFVSDQIKLNESFDDNALTSKSEITEGGTVQVKIKLKVEEWNGVE